MERDRVRLGALGGGGGGKSVCLFQNASVET